MRTIKFRGKRCDNGVWVYGYYARLSNEFKEWHCIMTEKDASENYIKDCNGYNMLYTPVDHNTVGQFTGLHDKNGKEIYEGDIIKNGTFAGVVDWNPIGNFFINENYGKRQDKCVSLGEMLENHYFIVAGNIHDNPELFNRNY